MALPDTGNTLSSASQSPPQQGVNPLDSPAIVRQLDPCMYCECRSHTPLFESIQDRLGYAAGTWSFWQCTTCGSAQLVPRPAEEDLQGSYPSAYNFAPELARGRMKKLISRVEARLFYEPQYNAQTKIVDRQVRRTSGKHLRLLDVGCGQGLRLKAFRNLGYDVTGADFRPETVDYVRQQLGVPAVTADAACVHEHFDKDSFDVVTAVYLLEHVLDVRAVLRSCLEVLKPGGWFVGFVPFVDSIQSVLLRGRWCAVTEAPRHLSIPSREGITRLCRSAGYENVMDRPDSLLACSGVFALSLFPSSSTTSVYGGNRWVSLGNRAAGIMGCAVATPWCAVENYVLRRPALAAVFSQKPI